MQQFFNDNANEIFAIINAILVICILPLVNKWLESHLTKERAARVETAIQSGLQDAIAAVTVGKNSTETMRAVINDPNVRDNVIALAQDYVQQTVPQAIDKLGISDPLDKVISARVDAAVAALAEKYTKVNTAIDVAAGADSKSGGNAV